MPVARRTMPMQFKALGADPAEEGCAYLLSWGSRYILLDCGLRDGLDDLEQAPDWVVISHAHLDHVRALPAFHRRFPDVPILATRETYHLAQGLGLEGIPPMRCLAYERAIPLDESLTLCLFPAGHLPGAAAVVLRWTDRDPPRTVVYTGDCSLSSTRFAEGLNLDALRQWQPDVVVMDGSLGAERYPSRRHQEGKLLEKLATALELGSIVVIPVPALGLGQDLLFMLKTHHHFTQTELGLTIWLDQGIAQGCQQYRDLLAGFPGSVRNFALYQDLFWEERVYPRVRPLGDPGSPLAGPGILFCDAERRYWDPLWQKLRGSGRLLTWLEIPEVLPQVAAEAWPLDLRERMEIQTCRWHSHCDSSTLVQMAHTLRPQHLVFVHGDLQQRADLAALPELATRYHVHAPLAGADVDLPRTRLDLPPPPPDVRYEASLDEGDPVRIQLPGQITRDPRWTSWADTGMLEARWQGSELILRGLTAREILRAAEAERIPLEEEGIPDDDWRQMI